MPRKDLRPHQREAVDAVLRALEPGPGGRLPARGLRTQVVMATGSGKTLVAARAAEELRARRTLVLVPSLDLLTQTAAAWREAGRRGPVLGVSSLREREAGFRNTTSAEELAAWAVRQDKATVFATYASLGLGTIERAHRAGLPAWDLVVVDEAHRTSGRIGKAWAVVHDNARVPAARRLYMTATPRLWQAGEDEGGGEEGPAVEGRGEEGPAVESRGEVSGAEGAPRRGELVASMADDPEGPFGAVCHRLSLSEAIDRGIVAPYQVVCVDVTDPAFQAALLLGADARSDAVRGARLAALQTAAVKAAAEEGLSRTLVFHHLTKEAEAFAAGLPRVAARLRAAGGGEEAPGGRRRRGGGAGRGRPAADATPYPREVWADWLCGEHKPLHRQRVLREFSAAGNAFLSSVRVLGEGVDTRACDSVFWADLRGSMPDLVQAVGRALRIRPGEGKVASLVVPVLLGPGETPDTMLTSKAYGDLARLLEALRAHDARVVEGLAQPQAPGAYQPTGRGAGEGGRGGVSGPARELLKFSTPRDPAALAAFISLRVLSPERSHWTRGMEAAAWYARLAGDLRVPFGFRVPGRVPERGVRERAGATGAPGAAGAAPEAGGAEGGGTAGEEAGPTATTGAGGAAGTGAAAMAPGAAPPSGGTAAASVYDASAWPAPLAGFPLGQWIADARRARKKGALSAERAARLDALGMVWSHFDVAFEEGLSAARGWAAEHGHLLAPADATWRGHPLGVWLKNNRAAARRAPGSPGALPEERVEALEEIDPAWCPAWSVAWQRCFRLARLHVEAGGELPAGPGALVVQGEDLGAWLRSQRLAWERLSMAQRWMLEHVLGAGPLRPGERPRERTPQALKWAANLAAARQFHHRERHLNVPRGHVETVAGVPYRLGAWVANARSRAARLSPERVAQLESLGMRWAGEPAGTPVRGG
ncbi:Helicase associated domain protein [Streptomyces sp. NPDC101132]|uniref:DEAD/DEAH box helicase n=1 Tax=Streptomyces sp. NPDC101132 TaxID=3366110 RepID=UPI00380760EC